MSSTKCWPFCLELNVLTWHTEAWCCICASVTLVITGSVSGLAPISSQAITRTNPDLLSIGPQEQEMLFTNTETFSMKKMHLKMSFWSQQQYNCLNWLNHSMGIIQTEKKIKNSVVLLLPTDSGAVVLVQLWLVSAKPGELSSSLKTSNCLT